MLWRKLAFPAMIAGIIGILYFNVISGEFLWDDQQFVEENRFLTSWTYLPEILTRSVTEGAGQGPSNFYRPLQAFTHFIDVQIYGLAPWGHRLTNVWIAMGVGIALFYLLQELLGGAKKAYSNWAAFFATLLYLCHPLQSSAIGYISGRGDLLVLLFFFLAALTFRKNLGLSTFFTGLALLSKENGILAPAFVIACDWAQAETKKRSVRERLLRYSPLIGLSACYLVLRLTVFNFSNTLNFYNTSNVLTENYSYRFFTYLTTLAKSMELIFWPFDLHHERSWSVYPNWEHSLVLSGFLVVSIILGTAFLSRKKAPLIAIGLAWFILATLPTSNLIALINALFYDHWFILPLLGFALALAWIFQKALEFQKQVGSVALLHAFIFIPMSVLTWNHNDVWTTQEKLFLHILKYEPKSSKVMNNLAMAYSRDPKTWEASQKLYERSLELSETAEARNNLGRLFLTQKKPLQAELQLRRALTLNPKLHQAHSGLGIALFVQKKCAEAIQSFEAALRIYPEVSAQEGLRIARLECR